MLSRAKKQGTNEDNVEEGGYYKKPTPTSALNTSSTLDAWSPLHAFALDYRSLALFRVVIGVVVIVDLISRSRSMFAHYANLGVWPIVEAIGNLSPHSFSFHFSNGNMPFQVIMLVVSLVVALFYMVGFKTRANSFLLWLLVMSLHNRNVLILNPGDDLLRMLLFWGMFMPLGERFSVDCAGQASAPTSNRYLSLTTASFVIQIMVMFWVGYLLKTGVEWEEGTAMYYIFNIDQYTTPFGYFVLRFPAFLVLLTKVYLLFEIVTPILLIVPMPNGAARLAGCVAIIAMYTFLGLCLELGLFTISPIVAALALLPTSFWDRTLPTISSYISPDVSTRYWSMGGSTTLYYSTSGASPLSTKILLQLANTFIGLNCPILAAERPGNQNFEPGEQQPETSDIGRYLSDNHLSWVAVDSTGKRHARHRGVLALLAENPFTAPIVPILSKLDKVVAFFYSFSVFIQAFAGVQSAIYYAGPGAPTSARVSRGRGPKLSEILAAVLLIYILWWNISTVNPEIQPRGDAQWLGLVLRIDQWWSMFTPSPMKDDGWFVIPAKLANGKEMDLLKPGGGPLSYEKPTFVSRTFKDNRWRRYLMNLWSGAHQDKRLFYGRYLCRQWNWYGKGSSDKDYVLKTFRIVYLKEITLPEGRVKGPEPQVLWEHQC